MSADLRALERDTQILGLLEKLNDLDDKRAAQIADLARLLANHIKRQDDELAELRDELVTHEQHHRRDIDALRESLRATDRVLNDRTAHLT